jgi:hypothetical protein
VLAGGPAVGAETGSSPNRQSAFTLIRRPIRPVHSMRGLVLQ